MILVSSFLVFLRRILPYALILLFVFQFLQYYDSIIHFWRNSNIHIWLALFCFGVVFSISQILLETYKWVIANEGHRGFWHSIKQILKGQAWAFITPAGWGDYYGRNHGFSSYYQPYGFLATLIGRIANSFPTLTIGLIAFSYYLIHFPPIPWEAVLLFWFLFVFILLIFLFSIQKYLKRVIRFFKLIYKRKFTRKRVLNVIFLSYVKFFVFSIQFVVFYYLMGGYFSSLISFCGILWTGYFVRQFLPPFFFANLGIRESVNVFLFTALGYPGELILQATLLVSFFNHILPAFFGTYLYWRDERRIL